MKKSIKQNLLVLFVSAICFALVGVFALNINAAFAEETIASKENFSLQAGASTRIKDDNLSGIRFKATVKSSYIEELTTDGATVEYYMLIAPSKNVNKVTDLTVETIEKYDAASIKSTSTPESGKDFDYYAAITYDNTELTAVQLEKAYDVELVARPYIVVTKDGTKSYIYADTTESTARSMRKVAYLALQGMAESKVTYTTAQFESILSYCTTTETKAVLEDNTSSIEFIDGTKYNGAKVYTQSVEDGNISLTEVGTVSEKAVAFSSSSLAVGETAPLYVLTEDGIIVTYYRAVTKIIKTAEDLQMFDLTNDKTKSITGYYVLGNNIVDTETNYNTASASAYTNGFGGTFDGFGHSVTFTCLFGLFNQFNAGAVVKNVAFKDIVLIDSGASAGSVLGNGSNLGNYTKSNSDYHGYNDICVTISDVYISVGSSWFEKKWSRGYMQQDVNKDGDKDDTIDGVYEGPNGYGDDGKEIAGDFKGWTNRTGILVSTTSAVDYKNVIVEIEAPDSYSFAPDLFRDAFYKTGGAYKAGFENVYVIGESVGNLTESQLGVTSGVENTTNFYSWYAGNDYYWNPPTEVGFYKTYDALTETETDLANKFASDCWTIVDGVPVWAAFVDNSVKIEEKIVFSGYAGADADNDDVKDQTIYCDEIEGTIQAVYLDTDTLRETNLYNATTGKVNLTNDTNVPVDYKVHIITTKNEYSATLEVYTRVLTSAADLRIFDQGSYANGYALVEGAFALGNDIVDTEHSYNTNGLMSYHDDSNIGGTSATNHNGDTVWYADYGFKGTFDGFGHYVTIKSGAGLFGQILPIDLDNGVYSVIKNVAFKDCELTTSLNVSGPNAYSYTSCLAYGGNFYYLSSFHSASNKKLVEVSNVYISLGSSYYNIPRHDNAYSMTAALISNDINNVEYNNVVVELSDPPADKHTASPNLFITSEAATMNDNLFNNVYLIGKTTDANVYGETTQSNSGVDVQLKLSRVLSDADTNSTPPTNVGLYTDTTAWKTAETDLAEKFTSDCWTIVDGVPVWKTLAQTAE